jgi:hypothetical protein
MHHLQAVQDMDAQNVIRELYYPMMIRCSEPAFSGGSAVSQLKTFLWHSSCTVWKVQKAMTRTEVTISRGSHETNMHQSQSVITVSMGGHDTHMHQRQSPTLVVTPGT